MENTSHSYTPSLLFKDPLLEISGLTLRPGRETLLANFSLSVERGTLHAIVGPNGAGKTTLLSAILGLMPFDGRISVRWQGRGRIAYVPQQFQVDRTLPITTADFLALSRQRRPVCLGVDERDGESGFRSCSTEWGSQGSTIARCPCCPAASCGACCLPMRSTRCPSC